LMLRRLPFFPLFPYTTLFRSVRAVAVRIVPYCPVQRGIEDWAGLVIEEVMVRADGQSREVNRQPIIGGRGARVPCKVGFHHHEPDRKSTRLNSSHLVISYAVF